jgi:hypothetical protein
MLIDFSAANTGRCRDEKKVHRGFRESRFSEAIEIWRAWTAVRLSGKGSMGIDLLRRGARRTWLHPSDPFHPIDPHYQGFDLRISRPISSRYSAMRQDTVVNSTIRVSDGKESQCPSGFDAPRHTWTFVANAMNT